jgi:hypothetical protein
MHVSGQAYADLSIRATLVLLSLVFVGCASTPTAGPGGDAEYRHPRTGDIQHCDNHTTAGLLLFGVIGAVVSGNNYADCKNDLEEKGYTRARATTQFERTAMTPAPLAPPFVPVGQSVVGDPPANRNIDLSQIWILGKWETFEKRSGSVDGLGTFEFRQVGKEITWSMERSGWVSGVQITQRASGSVKKLSDSAIELRGRYESSNLGNVVGTPVVQSFTRTEDTLRGWEAAGDGTQSLLSLKRVQ